MKKEVIIAIIIGIGIGLVITFGVKTAKQSLHQELQNPQPTLMAQGTTVAQAPLHTLFIGSPTDSAIVEDSKVVISGTTTPFSLIGALTSNDMNTTMADAQGNFTVNLNLLFGVNPITVTSITGHGDQAKESFTVVHTSADFDEIVDNTVATPSPTPKKRTP